MIDKGKEPRASLAERAEVAEKAKIGLLRLNFKIFSVVSRERSERARESFRLSFPIKSFGDDRFSPDINGARSLHLCKFTPRAEEE